MLGGPGAGTNAGFWSRFVMLEPVGTWAMELMHGLTGFTDIYPCGDDVDQQDPVMGLYDEMSAAVGRIGPPTPKAESNVLTIQIPSLES